MIYWLPRIASKMLYPLPFCLLLLAVGLGLLWFSRRQKLGKLLATLGSVFLLVLSFSPISVAALRALERGILPCTDPSALLRTLSGGTNGNPAAVWVMVLGTGYNPNPAYPFTLQVSSGFWSRLLEGVRLQRLCPGSNLILSIPGAATDPEKERFLSHLVDLFALDRSRLKLITTARNTSDEARLARVLIGHSPCLLVSDALHLKRAVTLFTQEGIQVLPAPSGFAVSEDTVQDWSPLSFFPEPDSLGSIGYAIHEGLGRLGARLR
jgi:uncharacterized SAM-binding protein YcdF (DUF218 family)